MKKTEGRKYRDKLPLTQKPQMFQALPRKINFVNLHSLQLSPCGISMYILEFYQGFCSLCIFALIEIKYTPWEKFIFPKTRCTVTALC